MKNRKILIVDDNIALSRMLKLQLDELGGFTVRVENQSSSAMKTAYRFKPDVVILDVMMPEIDGGQLAGMIQQDALLSKTPIIFLTGSVRKEEVENRKGFVGGLPFLAKPVRLDELLEAINKVAPLGSEGAGARAVESSV